MKPSSLWIQRIALLWAGVVIGCSFIATPVKFQAPSLSLSTALEIGRITFRSMAMAEVVLLLMGAVVLVLLRKQKSLFWAAGAVLAAQWLIVMPILNTHTDARTQGQAVDGPPLHLAYVALEIVKIVILLWIALRKSSAD